LYAASLIARRGKSRQKGIALSMLGYAIASFSAYLGGHLVFGEQIGVDHTATADQDQPKKFTAVMRASDLKERKPVRVDVEDAAVLLVRTGDTINALTNTCTHLGGPLNEGKLEGDSVRCPWHGSRFCLSDGKVLEGPATFDERVYEVRERDGQIEVRAGGGEKK
jgi:nitrite reductase/ring-hydroxylating ferredoxin subunit